MKRIFLSAIVALILLLTNSNVSRAQQTEILSWNDSKLYDGSLYEKTVTVEFVVVKSHNSGKACFLNAHSNWKKYFTAVIFRSDFDKCPSNPEEYYYMKKVRVNGTLKEYKGKPEIILKSPSQIEVIQ